MPNYELPALQNPNILGAYLQGRAAPGQLELQQQQVEQGRISAQEAPLRLDQLKLALQTAQMRNQEAQQFMGGQDGQPQAQTAPGSPSLQPGQSPLDALADPNRLASLARHQQFEAVLSGGDTIKPVLDAQKAQEGQMKDQQERAKFALQPQIDQIEAVRTDANPERLVMANPSYLKLWQQYAPQLGLHPNDPKDMTPENVRKAATLAHNNIAAHSMGGIAPIEMPNQLQTVSKGGYQYNVDPLSGKTSDIPGQTTPYQSAQLGMERERLKMAQKVSEGFSGKAGELLASLAEQGVALPAGLRSKEQQSATLNGLLEKHPDMTPDQIATQIRDGKINMAADTRQASVAGGIAGKVSYAENELESSIPLARTASANVPRGKFVPLNKLMQMANTSISDPDLLDLKIKTQSVLNAYDMLAARGGTDVGKREQQHSLLMSAQSPEAYERALKAFTQEAQVARKAGEASSHVGGTGVGGGGGHPQDIQDLLNKYGKK